MRVIEVLKYGAAALLLLITCVFLDAAEPPRTELVFEQPEIPPPPPPVLEAVPQDGAPSVRTGADLLQKTLAEGLQTSEAADAPASPSGTIRPSENGEEDQPLFPEAGVDATAPADRSGTERNLKSYSPTWMLLRLVIAMTIVGGLMAAAWWWLRRQRNLGAAPAGRGVLDVIARTPLEPGRSLLLVRAGERVIIVGSTAQGLSRLGEITDKEEVEALIRLAGQGKPDKAFPEELRRVEKEFDKVDTLT